MKFKALVLLLLMLLVAVFSVQNAAVITVRFLRWEFALSQALVIMLSAFCGALVGLIIGALGGRPRAVPPPPPARGPRPVDSP